MKIAIITIATGKYDIFIEDLIKSCEKYFLPGNEKKYFVFTDSVDIQSEDHIIRIQQDKLGWPFDTLKRFHMFCSIESKLMDFDYVFFMNANMKIVSTVGTHILELDGTSGIIATLHPGFYPQPKEQYPLERNKLSTFYVPFGSEKNYYQGCFNGGKKNEFIRMSRELMSSIDTDLSNNIIPVWHDESAMNWYLLDRVVKVLDPTFAYPDVNVGIPGLDPHYNIIRKYGDPKMLQLNKDDFGGKEILSK
jgi:hypothetical protein